jgi:hypothetical protein
MSRITYQYYILFMKSRQSIKISSFPDVSAEIIGVENVPNFVRGNR